MPVVVSETSSRKILDILLTRSRHVSDAVAIISLLFSFRLSVWLPKCDFATFAVTVSLRLGF
jgi:hypothetical protein